MTHIFRGATALLAALLLAACQPAPDTAPAAGSQGFDVRAFAGRFEGTLPCADCPGIDSRLELRADGSYSQRDSYRGRDASFDASGTWTVEDGGSRLRLHPDDEGGVDRLYGIVSNDALEMLSADGRPPDSGLDYTLRRAGATP